MTYLLRVYDAGATLFSAHEYESDLHAIDAAQNASEGNRVAIVFENDEGYLSPVMVFIDGWQMPKYDETWPGKQK